MRDRRPPPVQPCRSPRQATPHRPVTGVVPRTHIGDAVRGREDRTSADYAEALRTHLVTTTVRSAPEGTRLPVPREDAR